MELVPGLETARKNPHPAPMRSFADTAPQGRLTRPPVAALPPLPIGDGLAEWHSVAAIIAAGSAAKLAERIVANCRSQRLPIPDPTALDAIADQAAAHARAGLTPGDPFRSAWASFGNWAADAASVATGLVRAAIDSWPNCADDTRGYGLAATATLGGARVAYWSAGAAILAAGHAAAAAYSADRVHRIAATFPPGSWEAELCARVAYTHYREARQRHADTVALRLRTLRDATGLEVPGWGAIAEGCEPFAAQADAAATIAYRAERDATAFAHYCHDRAYTGE